MKLSAIKDSQKNIEQGAWVYPIPNLPGVKIKTRGMFNALATKMYAEARLAMTEEEFANEDVQKELNIRIMAEAVIMDWAGIVDDSGEPDEKGKYPPLGYDPEVAKRLLADPDYVLLSQGAHWAAANVATLGKQVLEENAKN